MTEAMSRNEIEDVLSSIRRLVSHEDRTDQAPARPSAPARAKLVLTSALRVDDGAALAEPEQNAESAALAQPHAALSDMPQEAEQAKDASPAFADASVRAPLLTRIAKAGQLSVASTAPGAALSNGLTPLATASDATQTAPTASTSSEAPVDVAVTDNVLEATLARLEEALSITPTEPDHAPTEAVIDEDALTQIVAKIVRQELQGELGERITRNIRKLVRAEVARELQMRNL